MRDVVLYEVADGVATVTLDRPEKLNPLTFESYADLRDLLHELPLRGDAKVLVILDSDHSRAPHSADTEPPSWGGRVRWKRHEFSADTWSCGNHVQLWATAVGQTTTSAP